MGGKRLPHTVARSPLPAPPPGPPLDHQTAPYLEVLKNYGGVSVLRIYGINHYQHGPEEGGQLNFKSQLGRARYSTPFS